MIIDLKDRVFLLTGVANKKSVATAVGELLVAAGAKIILSVQKAEQVGVAEKLFPHCEVLVCDVEKEREIEQLVTTMKEKNLKLDGLLHSLAYANYSEGVKPFHETKTEDFLQACQISCFSLTRLSAALKPFFHPSASVVTISISNTLATNYGYLGPIKGMLELSCAYLAKSFSFDSQVRFNAVKAGPLKTSASAGIPGYLENYLYAEKLTLRKKNLLTSEVAQTVLFLLSPLSSGINGTSLVVDAGMAVNTFEEEVVKTVTRL